MVADRAVDMLASIRLRYRDAVERLNDYILQQIQEFPPATLEAPVVAWRGDVPGSEREPAIETTRIARSVRDRPYFKLLRKIWISAGFGRGVASPSRFVEETSNRLGADRGVMGGTIGWSGRGNQWMEELSGLARDSRKIDAL
jgi:hypothetical protein